MSQKSNHALPKKESDLFKSVVKHYELKLYKKAIKQADQILKKFPNHGETLAMKGLTYSNMQRKEEAHALVKEGLRHDMRSHVCWHVYGLLYRSDHNYPKAIQAYKQALKMDPDNSQILRDLSWLQMQMRDLTGFQQTRYSLLEQKPSLKLNWLAFALGKHLCGDLEGAVRVLDIYLGTLRDSAKQDTNNLPNELQRHYEASELALYQNLLLGQLSPQRGLTHLFDCQYRIVDQTTWLRYKTSYHLSLKQYEEAKHSLHKLFDIGWTQDYRLHTAYMCALIQYDTHKSTEYLFQSHGTQTLITLEYLSQEQRNQILEHYQTTMSKRYPKCYGISRIILMLLQGQKQEEALLHKYIKRQIIRGVPSLIDDLSSFFWTFSSEQHPKPPVLAKDPLDVKAHPLYEASCRVLDAWMINLQSHQTFDAPKESNGSSDSLLEEEQPPSTLFWVWFLKAGLLELSGHYEEAISLLEQCLSHTPTALDVYPVFARLLSASGCPLEAAKTLDEGRTMDTQDRFLNNLTTQHYLEANEPTIALERMSLFTKHEGDPEQNLFDMQCCWYELDLADCYTRQKQFGRALRKFAAVIKHFEDFHEDQFDFHSYCIRKVTLRAYTDVLRWEDDLWGQPYYCRAAEGVIRIYLQIHDTPSLLTASENPDANAPDYSKMTPAERKKAKAIARKKKKAAEKKAAAAAAKKNDNANNGTNNKNSDKKSPALLDPDGLELLKKDPLEEAHKYSTILSRHASKNISTWILQYDVSIRRQKPLLALQALYKAHNMKPLDPEWLTRLVDFCQRQASNKQEEEDALVKEVIESELPLLLGHMASIEEFVQHHANKILEEQTNGEAKGKESTATLAWKCAVAEGLLKLSSEGGQECASKLILGHGSLKNVRGATVKTCYQALSILEQGNDTSAVAKWKELVKERFPRLEVEGDREEKKQSS